MPSESPATDRALASAAQDEAARRLPLHVRFATVLVLFLVVAFTWAVVGSRSSGMDPNVVAKLFAYFAMFLGFLMAPSAVIGLILVRERRTWWVCLGVQAAALGAGFVAFVLADDFFYGVSWLWSIVWLYGGGAVAIVGGTEWALRRRRVGRAAAAASPAAA